jgi:hypothetical protein
MKTLLHLTPMERMFVTGALKRHEPLFKPRMEPRVLVAALLVVGVTAIWVVLLIAFLRLLKGWL